MGAILAFFSPKGDTTICFRLTKNILLNNLYTYCSFHILLSVFKHKVTYGLESGVIIIGHYFQNRSHRAE